MNEFLLIELNGLTSGKSTIEGSLSKEFFAQFGNKEILNADIDVEIMFNKSGTYLGIDINMQGEVTVECDRCLEDLDLEVDQTALLEVKFGEEASDEPSEGEREVLFLSHSNTELDLSQIVYDYVCLSLPIQRHHEEGECNPDAVKYLCKQADADSETDSEQSNRPFAGLAEALGALTKDKN